MLIRTLAINCLFARRQERDKRGPSLDAVVKHVHDFFVVLEPPLFLQPSAGQAVQLVDRRDERGVCRLRLREKKSGTVGRIAGSFVTSLVTNRDSFVTTRGNFVTNRDSFVLRKSPRIAAALSRFLSRIVVPLTPQ